MTINEVLEALTPENARFVSGQNLYLYVPKAQTNKRYGLAKYSPDDFSIDSNGVLSLLLPKSQIEDYFDEIRGGTREETVIANPKINLLNLDKMDKELQNSIDDLYDKDKEIYGSGGRENTVLKGIDLTELNKRDNTLQDNIDYIIQDDRDDTATDSTYSANKITKLIHEAKLEGLHFVGFVGEEVGKDHEGEAITPKDGILWHVSDEASIPSINKQWNADTMFIYTDGNWVPYGEDYIPEDFAIWKNVNLPDSEINSWWWFETGFEVLDFNVDMSLYYTKVESDARYKPMFTYGTYLSEVDKVLTIDNLVMPTTGKLTSFVQGTDSVLDVDNVEDAIKLLEKNTKDEIDIINARPFWLPFNETPTRLGEYSVTTNGVYRSVVNEEGGFKWQLVTDDLDTLLPRANADVNVADGLSFTNDEETGYLLSKLSLINLNTEEKTNTPISIPVATNHTDGIMPATAMQALEELDIKVTALQSGVQSYFVDFGSDTPTQAALDLLYKNASGESGDIPNLTRLIDAERNIYYEYYTSLDTHWQGPFVYRYTVASLEQVGLVKSSEQKGQIFVEPVSGVMSLNGYTDIINTFNTLYGGEGRTQIDVNQVPSLPASKITSGTLNSARLPVVPVSKGGTNNSSFSAYKLVVTGSVDETDNTANSLNDGPAFGSVNTILAGNGANQIPSFKSRTALDLQLVSNKVTTTLSASNNDAQYPSAKLVFTELNKLSNRLSKYVTTRTKGKIWNLKTWGQVRISTNSLWSDGENIYLDSNLVLDKSTSTWNKKTWNGLKFFYGQYVWTDGENIYYSNNNDQYVLDKASSTWNVKTWNGLTSFRSNSIWTDGENIYYSRGTDQYILDKETSTWNPKTWNGWANFSGTSIWTDGENIYHSGGTYQYILDKASSTWNPKTWTGLTYFSAEDIWTDGETIYYSNGDNHCVLNKETSTWNPITWNGLSFFMGSDTWTDGENIYYSLEDKQYVLKDYTISVKPILNK